MPPFSVHRSLSTDYFYKINAILLAAKQTDSKLKTKMRIIILSRGVHLYSTQSLIEAARGRGHEIQVVDLTRLTFVIETGGAKILP